MFCPELTGMTATGVPPWMIIAMSTNEKIKDCQTTLHANSKTLKKVKKLLKNKSSNHRPATEQYIDNKFEDFQNTISISIAEGLRQTQENYNVNTSNTIEKSYIIQCNFYELFL